MFLLGFRAVVERLLQRRYKMCVIVSFLLLFDVGFTSAAAEMLKLLSSNKPQKG